jgi:hypothetical protein
MSQIEGLGTLDHSRRVWQKGFGAVTEFCICHWSLLHATWIEPANHDLVPHVRLMSSALCNRCTICIQN